MSRGFKRGGQSFRAREGASKPVSSRTLSAALKGIPETPGVLLGEELKALESNGTISVRDFVEQTPENRANIANAIQAGISDFEKNGPNSEEATADELDADRSARIKESVEEAIKENKQSFIANVDAKSQTIYSYEPGSTFSNNWEYDEKDVGRAKAAYEDTKATAQSLALLASVDSMTKQGVSRKDALELREKHLPKFMEALQRLSVTAPTMVTTVSDMARISKEKGKGSKELRDVANKANGLKNGYNNIVFDLEAAQKDFVKDLRDKLGIYKK